MEKENELKVVIFRSDIKLEVLENIKIIRIKSDKYNLLIMKDYWPVIGQIDGTISFEGETSSKLENIKGFYALSHNVFNLILEGNSYD